MLYSIGLGERVVAVSHECAWPPEIAGKPRVTYANIDSSQPSGAIDDEVHAQLAAGRPLYEIDRRALVELAPDLIVTQAQCDVCAVKYDDVVETVGSEPALRHAQIVSLNPQSLDDVLADIERIGRAAGAALQAEQYVGSLRERIEHVQHSIGRVALRPTVAVIEWIEPLMLAGNWTPELVSLAGGESVLARAGEHSGYTPWSDLCEADPEVILIAPCGFDLPRTLQEAQLLLERESWAQLSAVRAGRVFACDGNAYFNRSGPRLVDTVEMIAHLLHPRAAAPCAWMRDETSRPFEPFLQRG